MIITRQLPLQQAAARLQSENTPMKRVDILVSSLAQPHWHHTKHCWPLPWGWECAHKGAILFWEVCDSAQQFRLCCCPRSQGLGVWLLRASSSAQLPCQGLPAEPGAASTSHHSGLPAECCAMLWCLPARQPVSKQEQYN